MSTRLPPTKYADQLARSDLYLVNKTILLLNKRDWFYGEEVDERRIACTTMMNRHVMKAIILITMTLITSERLKNAGISL